MKKGQGVGAVARNSGFRVALVLPIVLALAAVAAGPAVGQTTTTVPDQSATVTNGGGAEANSGGNSATGNSSGNNAASESTQSGGVLGLLGATLGIGSTTNDSTGSAGVNSGTANAAGSQSGTSATQSGGGGCCGTAGSGCCGTATNGDSQALFVGNSGSGEANTGGNSATGNNSTNNASINQTATGGLLGANVNLGSVSNNSNGTSNINSGNAQALGNAANNSVTQQNGLGGECRSNRLGTVNDGHFVGVGNAGDAEATTGNNRAVGNESVNNVTAGVDVEEAPSTTAVTLLPGVTLPAVLGLSVGLGDTSNNSDGTANVSTGAANAAGNQATNAVNQNCGVRPVVLHDPRFGSPDGPCCVPRDLTRGTPGTPRGGLALTGLDTGQQAGIALALLIVGVVLAGSARRRIVAHRQAAALANTRPKGWLPAERPAKSGDVWDDVLLEEGSASGDGTCKVESLV